MTTHVLKVVPPYMDALLDGSKRFEVRRNDRGYQRGDVVRLREYDRSRGDHDDCAEQGCRQDPFTGREATFEVGYVFSGDPRFGGVEPGYVVLSLSPAGSSGRESSNG